MGWADGTYFGQAKVVCHCKSDSDNGKTITITDGVWTRSATVTDLTCTFDVPKKGLYTVTLGTFSMVVPVSYGEYKDVIVAEGYEPFSEHDVLGYDEIATAEDLTHKLPLASAVRTIIDAINVLTGKVNANTTAINAQKITAGTTPMTSGSSKLASGNLYIQYK